jgi:histidinol dehydrogenase
MTRNGLKTIAPTVTTLAREEGLEAHARSIEIRIRRPERKRETEVAR